MKEPVKIRFKFLRFLFSRVFLKNLALAIAVFIFIFIVLIIWLRHYTKHGDEVVLPDFTGMNLSQLSDSVTYAGFDFEVIDSVYGDVKRGGEIIKQSPTSGLKVKEGRNVYLTVIALTAEKVIVPDLKYLTVRHALSLIKQAKLEIGKIEYTPNFAKNAVLGQFYLGDTLNPGDTLLVETKIDLLVGSGEGKFDIPVPYLVGMNRADAIAELTTASFNLGKEVYLDSVMDENARVFYHSPMYGNDDSYFAGDSIDIWYRSVDSLDFEFYATHFYDSITADTLFIDTLNIDTLQMNEF